LERGLVPFRLDFEDYSSQHPRQVVQIVERFLWIFVVIPQTFKRVAACNNSVWQIDRITKMTCLVLNLRAAVFIPKLFRSPLTLVLELAKENVQSMASCELSGGCPFGPDRER
jgi:hypothetical protein